MGKLLGWLHARAQAVLCLDYRYMSASDMTQNRTGFIIQGERISHANKMQIVHFKRRILSTEKKIKYKAHAKVWANLCFTLVLPVCASTIASYNIIIRVLYDTENKPFTAYTIIIINQHYPAFRAQIGQRW